MLIFLCVVVGLMWVSYVKSRQFDIAKPVPRFSSGRPSYRSRAKRPSASPARSVLPTQRKPVPRFSSGRPDYQSRAKRQRAQSQTHQTSKAVPVEIFPASPFHRLTRLTRNVDTADRLVKQISAMNPDQSLLWCVQKAIYDIERDRMS